MTISILGCGWYGKALARVLLRQNITVKGSVTSAEKFEQLAELGILPYLVRLGADERYDAHFFECDILVISIPPKTRQGESAAYLPKIQSVVKAVTEKGVQKVIYISSTAVYGDSNSEVTENDLPVPDTDAGRILLAAENLLRSQINFKTAVLRFAGLIGPGRHPGRFFSGKTRVPNGGSPVNLIHLDDCIGLTSAIIEKDAFGSVFNGVSPHHPLKADFYRRAAIHGQFTVPEFNDELKNWKIVDSMQLTGGLKYKFQAPNLYDCLSNDLF